MTTRIFTGTSGFSFPEWKGTFYPAGLKEPDMLAYYASKLGVVEINNTFYRMPKTALLEGWAAKVPADFRFVLKASQKITHIARLVGTADNVAYLWNTAQVLGDRLGPLLFQTPPNLKRDDSRLTSFLGELPVGCRAAFELRHPSWNTPETLDLLRGHGQAAWCLADVDDAAEPELPTTAPFVYLRLRRTAYDEEALVRWRDRIRASGVAEAYVFFKHEDGGVGPRLAERLGELAKV